VKNNDRRCLSCQKIAPKSEFWRVVRVHNGSVQLDTGMGRSGYLCPNPECLKLAEKKNRLGRSLKIQIPPAIFEELKSRLS
jgi:uncharacterized protein